MKRFYKDVTVSAAPFQILLDGRAVKTPMKNALVLPTAALAEALAEEWRGQGDDILPGSMALTKLANTAIDRVAAMREDVIGQVMAFANDTLCYRAASPEELAARQAGEFDPVLAWASERYGVRFETRTGIVHFSQSAQTLAALRAAVAAYDDFTLTALHSSASLLTSLVLALALAEGRLSGGEAFAISQLDERYQAERWGEDNEAVLRSQALVGELLTIETFLRLAK